MSEPQHSDVPQGLRRRLGSSTTSRLEQRVVEGARPHPEPGPARPPQAPRGKRTWLIVGVVVVIVLLLGGVVLGALFRPRGSGGAVAPTPGTAVSPAGPTDSASAVRLRFLPPQEHTAQGWADFQTLVGDVNGDGRADLIWNLAAESNLTYVALADAAGAFTFLPLQDRPEKRWGGFRTLVGDVNGDGRDDLVWNETAETNRLYVGLGGADGTFQFLPAQDRAEKHWGGFRTLAGDVNGDGRTDLVWNETAETNRLYVGLGSADGTLRFLPAQDHPDSGWEGVETLAGDVNGDGRTDLVWIATGEMNRVAVALAGADGTFQYLAAQEYSDAGLAGYTALIGDVNGDGRADLVWNQTAETNRTVVALAGADGTLTLLPPQDHVERGWAGFTVRLADVDGDGRGDLVWNEAGVPHRTYLALGTSAGTWRFLPAQDHTDLNGEGYRLLVDDVNGDGRADLVWNAAQETNRIVVGLSEP